MPCDFLLHTKKVQHINRPGKCELMIAIHTTFKIPGAWIPFSSFHVCLGWFCANRERSVQAPTNRSHTASCSCGHPGTAERLADWNLSFLRLKINLATIPRKQARSFQSKHPHLQLLLSQQQWLWKLMSLIRFQGTPVWVHWSLHGWCWGRRLLLGMPFEWERYWKQKPQF